MHCDIFGLFGGREREGQLGDKVTLKCVEGKCRGSHSFPLLISCHLPRHQFSFFICTRIHVDGLLYLLPLDTRVDCFVDGFGGPFLAWARV